MIAVRIKSGVRGEVTPLMLQRPIGSLREIRLKLFFILQDMLFLPPALEFHQNKENKQILNIH